MEKSLDSRWKELLYSSSGFGPNFLMVLMGAYFTDAINPAALGNSHTYQAIMSGTCFILPSLFPILYLVGRVFDGIIDIPFAHITDTLSTKFGRRRPPIAVSLLPMMFSYVMCWTPIGGAEGKVLNSWWMFFWSLIFYASYTMCLIAFYGSLSTVCTSVSQRVRVSGYKSFFDTINYCIVYALVPLILESFKISIDVFARSMVPLMLTMVFPLVLIKEGAKYGYPELLGISEKKIGIAESLKMTFSNRVYMRWLCVESCTTFGLQLFLVSMNALITGGMGFNGVQMAITNTCAFAPVPIMLYLFSKARKKYGVRPVYQTCLASFGICIFAFFIGSRYMLGDSSVKAQMIIAAVGGVIGSWAIGTFFMMPYLAASQISSVEEKIFGINHSAMYFAAAALVNSVVGAVATSLIYENIKMLFISKAARGVVYAENTIQAAAMFGVPDATVYNLGTLLVPFVVCFSCFIAIVLAFRIPRDFTEYEVAKAFCKFNPGTAMPECIVKNSTDDETDFVFVQVALCVLSGFVFGFIWPFFLFPVMKRVRNDSKPYLLKVLSCILVPFASVFVLSSEFSKLEKIALAAKIPLRGKRWFFVVSGIIFPVLPLNIPALAVMQRDVNCIIKCKKPESDV